jgi:hypothetical protein
MCSRRRDHCSAHGTLVCHYSSSPCTDRGVSSRGEEDKFFHHRRRRSSCTSTSVPPLHVERLRRLEEDKGGAPAAGRGRRELDDDGGCSEIRRLCSTGGEGNSIPNHRRGGPHRRGAPVGGVEGAASAADGGEGSGGWRPGGREPSKSPLGPPISPIDVRATFASALCFTPVGDEIFCLSDAVTIHKAKHPLPLPLCITLLDSTLGDKKHFSLNFPTTSLIKN